MHGVRVDNVTSFSSGMLLQSTFGGALHTDISGYDYQYSRGVYSSAPGEFPRYGIESVTLPDSVNEVKMEHSRITGADRAGYVAFDPCDPFDVFTPCDFDPHPGSVVDLGGGPLGSDGFNSIAGNGQQWFLPEGVVGDIDLLAANAIIHAEHNWWGTADPVQVAARMVPGVFGWGRTIDYTPFLTEAPPD